MSKAVSHAQRESSSEPTLNVRTVLDEILKEKPPKRRVNLKGTISNIKVNGTQMVNKMRHSQSLQVFTAPSDPSIAEAPRSLLLTSSLVVVGGTRTGKSTLLTRFIQHNFFSDYKETLAAQFYARNYECTDSSGEHEAKIRMQLWDTPGHKLMRATLPMWLRSANLVLVLFDVTAEGGAETFKEAKELLAMANACLTDGTRPVVFLVGTKTDETPSLGRFVPKQEMEAFAAKLDLPYYEVSSRTGVGIDSLFSGIGVALVDEQVAKRSKAVPGWISDKSTPVCLLCRARFTLTNRRHHCRNCGGLFCGRCSSRFISLPKIGKLLPTRVCNTCYDSETVDTAAEEL